MISTGLKVLSTVVLRGSVSISPIKNSNQHVFKMVPKEHEKEKINWSYIEFVDNQDVLDLIEKKSSGIIAFLDEARMFPKSTHEIFT